MEKELIEVQKYFKDAKLDGKYIETKDYRVEVSSFGYMIYVYHYDGCDSCWIQMLPRLVDDFNKILAVLKAISDIGSE